MYPIINTLGQNISQQDFRNNFLSICKDHHKNNRALAFAFIFYDYTTPHVSKILNDDDYWKAIHHISSNRLTVYYVDCRDQFLNERVIKFKRGVFYNSIYGIEADSNDPSIISVEILRNYFGIEEEIKVPSILFFQIDETNITDYMFLELKENEVEKTYNEIYEILYCVSDALKGIAEECYGNYREIYNVIKNALEHRKHKIIVSKLAKIIPFGKLLPLLFKHL